MGLFNYMSIFILEFDCAFKTFVHTFPFLAPKILNGQTWPLLCGDHLHYLSVTLHLYLLGWCPLTLNHV